MGAGDARACEGARPRTPARRARGRRQPPMRIVEVRFFPWGPFDDLRLDLEGDVLHVVYGRNEAGKSSALRGIRAALFGVPLRTADDFRHEMGKLCIGARLRRSDG